MHVLPIVFVVLTISTAISAEIHDAIVRECPSEDTEDIINIPHECDCTKFYMCFNGKKYVKQCPTFGSKGKRLHFNPQAQTCGYPKAKICSTTCVDADTSSSHEWNCRFYYQLEDGKRILKKCDFGYLYDKALASCQLEIKVDCQDKCPEAKSDDLLEGVNLPHDWQCNTYLKCDKNGTRVFHKCRDGEEFDDDTRTCTVPEKAACGRPISRAKCPETGSMKRFPHKTNCSQYYQCDNGKKLLQDCFDGLYFNPNIESCDLFLINNMGCK